MGDQLIGRALSTVVLVVLAGNIVQTYPAVEYDFVPNSLVCNPGDLIHFQWTGRSGLVLAALLNGRDLRETEQSFGG